MDPGQAAAQAAGGPGGTMAPPENAETLDQIMSTLSDNRRWITELESQDNFSMKVRSPNCSCTGRLLVGLCRPPPHPPLLRSRCPWPDQRSILRLIVPYPQASGPAHLPH